MALNADNVIVALTGAALTAPKGTTAPTNTTAAWGVGWVDLGYISEDGITETPNDETNAIPAWQNGDTVREDITGSKTTYQFTVIECTRTALELYYPGSLVEGWDADGHGAASMEVRSPRLQRRAFGFDVIDGDRIIRWVVPDGSVSERGELVYKNGDPIGFDLTITAYPDSDGVHTVRFFSDLAGLPTTDPA